MVLSPRMRFDLIINQFVLDAFLTRELIIYQRGYSRSFIHVFDVVRCLIAGMQSIAASVTTNSSIILVLIRVTIQKMRSWL